jgi:uncharacterized membrane protein
MSGERVRTIIDALYLALMWCVFGYGLALFIEKRKSDKLQSSDKKILGLAAFLALLAFASVVTRDR